ncbi:hypothetical protein BDA99DRAFT_534738 [Phascolomyces articulosus]|uniref:Uncharacterized protein n=1 Tax=Phascolomyces articulosus TaxID=60185 RepID=A0AAD5PGX2_9FUNG|nr:hypothetical protein BDA99DRAFT_534738 [Phascolomyces articulosus]
MQFKFVSFTLSVTLTISTFSTNALLQAGVLLLPLLLMIKSSNPMFKTLILMSSTEKWSLMTLLVSSTSSLTISLIPSLNYYRGQAISQLFAEVQRLIALPEDVLTDCQAPTETASVPEDAEPLSIITTLLSNLMSGHDSAAASHNDVPNVLSATQGLADIDLE